MSTVLNTKEINYQLERLIDESDFFLKIVSPYLSLSDKILNKLIQASKRDVEIDIIYGKEELTAIEIEKLKKIPNLRLFYYENLHAKIYIAMFKSIVTSMNLYQFSQENNFEMGILLEYPKDEKELLKLLDETKILRSKSKVIELDSLNIYEHSDEKKMACCHYCGCDVPFSFSSSFKACQGCEEILRLEDSTIEAEIELFWELEEGERFCHICSSTLNFNYADWCESCKTDFCWITERLSGAVAGMLDRNYWAEAEIEPSISDYLSNSSFERQGYEDECDGNEYFEFLNYLSEQLKLDLKVLRNKNPNDMTYDDLMWECIKLEMKNLDEAEN